MHPIELLLKAATDHGLAFKIERVNNDGLYITFGDVTFNAGWTCLEIAVNEFIASQLAKKQYGFKKDE